MRGSGSDRPSCGKELGRGGPSLPSPPLRPRCAFSASVPVTQGPGATPTRSLLPCWGKGTLRGVRVWKRISQALPNGHPQRNSGSPRQPVLLPVCGQAWHGPAPRWRLQPGAGGPEKRWGGGGVAVRVPGQSPGSWALGGKGGCTGLGGVLRRRLCGDQRPSSALCLWRNLFDVICIWEFAFLFALFI